MSIFFEWKSEIYKDRSQKDAFESTGNAVVIAGPGSGKTRVLALKVAQLTKEEIDPPQGIACLTYTRMMAKELEVRLQSLGVVNHPNIVVSTIHGFCLGEILRPFLHVIDTDLPKPIRIVPKETREKILYDLGRKLGLISGYSSNFQSKFDMLRRKRIDIPLEYWKDQQKYFEAINLYKKQLFSIGYVDFDFLVEYALRLIIDHSIIRNTLAARFPWFAVDEYQDLGYPFYRIITELLNRTNIKIFAIGDPDQSIYDFMGTDPKYLLSLKNREDVSSYNLLYNYRCAKEIIQASITTLGENRNYLSKYNGGRIRIFRCSNGFSQQSKFVCTLVKRYISDGFDPNKIAIFHKRRNNLNIIAKNLREENIEYSIDKSEYYDRNNLLIKWLEELGYWCLQGWSQYQVDSSHWSFDELLTTWLGFGNSEKISFQNNSNHARIYFSDVLWKLQKPNQLLADWLKTITNELDLESIFRSYRDSYPDDVKEFYKLKESLSSGHPLENLTVEKFSCISPCIKLTTLHSCKGMEFDIVIVTGIENIKSEKNDNETRLFYVSITRAKKFLDLIFTPEKISKSGKVSDPYPIIKLTNEATLQNWKFVQTFEVKSLP